MFSHRVLNSVIIQPAYLFLKSKKVETLGTRWYLVKPEFLWESNVESVRAVLHFKRRQNAILEARLAFLSHVTVVLATKAYTFTQLLGWKVAPPVVPSSS